ncbi:MAG: hypothetical protein KGZ34_07570 [Nitrosarchaeum sp.]|nr:hypothetical protein [Nitrosarchaeum sp.]
MLDIYFATERKLIELSWIIPLDNNPVTYSPELYSILQSSCGQVENMLRMLCEICKLPFSDKKFPEYYKLLDNSTNLLKRQWIYNKKTRETFHPLEIEDGCVSPSWWRGYNGTKHNLPEGLTKGNIENTVNALGALYAIHCISYTAQHHTKDIFETSNWFESDISLNSEYELDRVGFDTRPKSDLFYCATKFNKDGAPI